MLLGQYKILLKKNPLLYNFALSRHSTAGSATDL